MSTAGQSAGQSGGRGNHQLVVMSRWPAAGRCKSRLARVVGIERAARIQARLCRHCLAEAGKPGKASFETVLAVEGLGPAATCRWGRELGARAVGQGNGVLGLRLARQVRRARRERASRVVLIGTDLPDLWWGDLTLAFASLERQSLVLGPAEDGGYWLIGLAVNQLDAVPLFSGLDWGSSRVLEQTLAIAQRGGLGVELLALRRDLDQAEDLRRWR